MNKKILGITGALTVAGVLGLGIYQSDASQAEPTLDYDDVSQLLSTDYPGTVTEFELEEENDRLVYEIEIENEDVEYELIVDANSGEVLKSEKEHVDFNQPVDEGTKQTDQAVRAETKEDNTIISEKEAIEIALEKFSGKVEEVELDKDDGRLIYEIEIEKGELEAEFDIDAKTGKILDMEIDD